MPTKYSLSELKNKIPAWIRVYFFFCSRVNSYVVLKKLHELLCQALEEGWSLSYFVDSALTLLEELRKTTDAEPDYYSSINELWNCDRLKRIYEVHNSLICGYNSFISGFNNMQLAAYPCYSFFRQDGAKTKRPDHVKNEGAVRLKTDIDFWVAMNNEKDGGFGLPYCPFGFRSWMRLHKISRRECIEIYKIMHERDKPDLSPEYREKWGLPMSKKTDFKDPKRLLIVSELKRWGVWSIRKKILAIMHPNIGLFE